MSYGGKTTKQRRIEGIISHCNNKSRSSNQTNGSENTRSGEGRKNLVNKI